jgi:Carboxypeptidase regulatory-like domain
MRLVGAIFAIVLLAPFAQGQDNTAQGSPSKFKPDQLCSVEGTAVNSVTGEPERSLLVTLSAYGGHAETGQHSAMTDANGHFVIDEVEPGSYSLQAGGGGIPYQMYGQQSPSHNLKVISLEAGQNERGIVFKIAPGAVITGTVYDENGDPVVGANVRAFEAGGVSRSGSTGGQTQTDDRGEYRIYGLVSGKYMLMAEPTGQNQGSNDLYLPSFYPGTTDEAQASPIEVKPGDEIAAINLILTRVHGVRVRGRVINAPVSKDGNAIYVSLQSSGPENKHSNLNYGAPMQDEKGDFEIKGVPPGSYFAVARWNDGKNMMAGRTPVEVTSVDVDNVALVLKLPVDIAGRVRTESGTFLNIKRLHIWLQPAERQYGSGSAGVEPDGTFLMRQVFDGTFRIRVVGLPEEFYLKSARLGDSDILAQGFTLAGGQAPGTLQIEISRNGGTISGTVLNDSKPVPNALVVLVPDSPNRSREDLFSFKHADLFGRFNMVGLPPGDFKLFAWDSMLEVDAQDPEFMKAYEDRGQPVHVEERSAQIVQLELISIDKAPQ